MSVTSIVIIVCTAIAAVLFLASVIFLIHELSGPKNAYVPESGPRTAMRSRPVKEASASGVSAPAKAEPAPAPAPQPAPYAMPAQQPPVAMFIRLGGPGEAPVTTSFGPAPALDGTNYYAPNGYAAPVVVTATAPQPQEPPKQN